MTQLSLPAAYRPDYDLGDKYLRFLHAQCRSVGCAVVGQALQSDIFAGVQKFIDRALMVGQELEAADADISTGDAMYDAMQLFISVLDEFNVELPWSLQHVGALIEYLLTTPNMVNETARVDTVMQVTHALFERYSPVWNDYDKYAADFWDDNSRFTERNLLQLVLDFPTSTVKCFLDYLQREESSMDFDRFSSPMFVISRLLIPRTDRCVDVDVLVLPSQLQIDNVAAISQHPWLQAPRRDEFYSHSFMHDTMYEELYSVVNIRLPRRHPIRDLLIDHPLFCTKPEDKGKEDEEDESNNRSDHRAHERNIRGVEQQVSIQCVPSNTINNSSLEHREAESRLLLRNQELEREAARAEAKRVARLVADRHAAKQERKRCKSQRQHSSTELREVDMAASAAVTSTTDAHAPLTMPVMRDTPGVSAMHVADDRLTELRNMMRTHPTWSRSKARAALLDIRTQSKNKERDLRVAIEAARRLDPVEVLARNITSVPISKPDDTELQSSHVSSAPPVHPALMFERQRRKQLKQKRAAIPLEEFRKR